MNVLTVTGNLGQDAKVREAGSTSVCNFSVAMTSGYGDKKQTNWLDCSLFGKQAESSLPSYLVKGAKVSISGELGTRQYEGKTYLTLRVNQITLCGGMGDKSERQETAQRTSTPPASVGGMDMSDDIPFAAYVSGRMLHAI